MDVATVEAELRVANAKAQLVRCRHDGPSDRVMRLDACRLDLSLTPRPANARARYVDGWSPHRYERLGPVFFVPAGRAVQFRTDGGDVASIACVLDADLLRAWLACEPEWTDRQLTANLSISDANIRNLLLRLGQELRCPGFASQTMAELIVGQLAIELGRHCAALAEARRDGGLPPWRLRVIDERLAQAGAAPTLSELAGLCNLSVRQLTRGFRASRGCSLGRHIEQGRVEQARRRLGGDESVKQIAYALGFSTPSNFSFAFRRATGLTPNQYRQTVSRRS